MLRGLEEVRKNQIPYFRDIHNLFGFYGLIFMQFEKIRSKLSKFMKKFLFRKLWIFFLFISQKTRIIKSISFDTFID